MGRVCCGSPKGGNVSVEGKDVYTHVPAGDNLCNHHPAEASTNDCSNSGSSSHQLQGCASVCFHLSQWVRLRRKNSAFPDCVCFTTKPMLCLGRLVLMKPFTIGLFYQYLRLFYSFVRMSDITINCLHCRANLYCYLSMRNFNTNTKPRLRHSVADSNVSKLRKRK